MCVDHLHCWSPGRMAIWGGFPVQGWNPLCDADPPRGSTFFFWVGDGQTSCEWAPDTQGDHRWGFVAACAAIPCRLFRWMVSQLVLTSTLGILKLEKQLLSYFLPVWFSLMKLQLASFFLRDQRAAVRGFGTTPGVLSGQNFRSWQFFIVRTGLVVVYGHGCVEFAGFGFVLHIRQVIIFSLTKV